MKICLAICLALSTFPMRLACASPQHDPDFRRMFLIGLIVTDGSEITLRPPPTWEGEKHILVRVVGDADVGFQSLWETKLEAPGFWHDKIDPKSLRKFAIGSRGKKM
jgi:hypothetical protein